jgi:hypothetical protein
MAEPGDPYTLPFPPAFIGLDKSEILFDAEGLEMVRSLHKENPPQVWSDNPMVAWYEELYKNRSNLNFTGLYLNAADPLPGTTKKQYNLALLHFSNDWSNQYNRILKQGWGIWFLIQGHTYTNHEKTKKYVEPEPHWERYAEERGKIHAQFIKSIVGNFETDAAGSAVFIDNEGNKITDALANYYRAFFDELCLDGPEPRMKALRPGVYGFGANIAKFFGEHARIFSDHRDLFPWVVTGLEHFMPFDDSFKSEKVRFRTEDLTMWTYTRRGQSTKFLSVGEQTRLNYNRTGDTLPKFKKTNLREVPMWDFNSSFVRDPRYPEGNPRFTFGYSDTTTTRAGSVPLMLDSRLVSYVDKPQAPIVLVRGAYDKPTGTMLLHDIANSSQVAVPGRAIESEAPLVLTPAGDLFTYDATGAIATSRRTGANWSKLAQLPLPADGTKPRRLRTLCAAAVSLSDAFVFFASREHKIHALARRAPSSGKNPPPRTAPLPSWSAPFALDIPVAMHPFTPLTLSQPFPGVVNLYFQSTSRTLYSATIPAVPSLPWPPRTIPLTTLTAPAKPPLLRSSSLVACHPDTRTTLLFAVSTQSTLFVFSRQDPESPLGVPPGLGEQGKWVGPHPVGARETLVLPHAKLCTLVVPGTSDGVVGPEVLVGGFSIEGTPAVWTVVSKGAGVWEGKKRKLPSKKGKTPVVKTGKVVPEKEEYTERPDFFPVVKGKENLHFGNAKLGTWTEVKQLASGWDANPYGDISLDRAADGAVVFTITGVRPGRGGILRCRINDLAWKWTPVDDRFMDKDN